MLVKKGTFNKGERSNHAWLI